MWWCGVHTTLYFIMQLYCQYGVGVGTKTTVNSAYISLDVFTEMQYIFNFSVNAAVIQVKLG